MTPNQRWLLAAANDARELVERLLDGKPLRGMYEDLEVGRNLAAAIAAVEGEGRTTEKKHDDDETDHTRGHGERLSAGSSYRIERRGL